MIGRPHGAMTTENKYLIKTLCDIQTTTLATSTCCQQPAQHSDNCCAWWKNNDSSSIIISCKQQSAYINRLITTADHLLDKISSK